MSRNKKVKGELNDFAKGHLDIYKKFREQYLQTNFWNFMKRNDLTREMRIAQYHFKKAAGRSMTPEDIKS